VNVKKFSCCGCVDWTVNDQVRESMSHRACLNLTENSLCLCVKCGYKQKHISTKFQQCFGAQFTYKTWNFQRFCIEDADDVANLRVGRPKPYIVFYCPQALLDFYVNPLKLR
jgi:hypothetical protein